MKKFLDRYLFSRLGLQIAFSVVIILLFSYVGTQIRTRVTNHKAQDVYSQTFWGFRQITDGGSMAGTLDELDMVAEQSGNTYGAPVVLVIALLSWLIGMVLYSFVTGAVVNAFEGRRDKIEGGKVRYRFRNHGLVIGWDFQGVASVMSMFDIWGLKEVLVLSEQPAEKIRAELENELDERTMRNVFIYNGAIGADDCVDELYPEFADIIVVLGDRDKLDNDGGNMKIGAILRQKIAKAFKLYARPVGKRPIQLYIDISNVYNLTTAEMYPAEGYVVPKGLEVHIVNFCKSTVRELYSSFQQFVEWNSGRRKGLYETPYKPLSFRRNDEATHPHLVVAGLGDMAKAIVLELATLLGGGRESGRITVFSSDEDEILRFSSAYRFEELQGVEIEFVKSDIDSSDCRARLAAIAHDVTASVTIFITNENADEACAMANRLPREVRFENVRLMIEQRILSKWAHKTYPLQMQGLRDVAFFGFIDRFFSSLEKRATLEDFMLGGLNLKKRDCYFYTASIDGILENLTAHGYCFEYNPGRMKTPVEKLDDDVIEAMSRFEHQRKCNFSILHGLCCGLIEDDVFKTSPTISPWNEVDADVRKVYAETIVRQIAVLNKLYNKGEFPYIVEKESFRCVVGAMPDVLISEDAETRRAIRDQVLVPEMNKSKWRQNDGKEKSGASLAIALVPGKGLSRQLYRLSFLHSIPMIIVLPSKIEVFLSGFEQGSEREEYARWIRNAHSIVVAEKSPLNDVIRSVSTEVLYREGDEWKVCKVSESVGCNNLRQFNQEEQKGVLK